MSTKKLISNVNNRGYLFVGKLEGCPEMGETKTFDVHVKEDTKEVTFTFHKDETGKEKAGDMVRNGYLQVGKVYGKDTCEILSIAFRGENKVSLTKATKEEIDEFNKAEQDEKAKKTAERKAPRPAAEVANEIDKLIKEGIVKAIPEKPGRYEYVKPEEVKEGDTVTCLRTSGTFTVKNVNAEKGVVTANDRDSKNHFFSTREIAKVK